MKKVIGSCSICGGDVEAYSGPWMSTEPPPPPTCRSCGAVSTAHKPVIPMRKEVAPPGWKINNPNWPTGHGEYLVRDDD